MKQIMNCLIAVDGGGSKTEFSISDLAGKRILSSFASGCSYQSIGLEASVDLISRGVRNCLNDAGIKMEECAGACIGIPCYGENPKIDQEITSALYRELPIRSLYLTNDVEIAWAGATDCQPGIHIVAGTGSIAYGRDAEQNSVRSGGWHEFFGDEGSCYWIGREGMSLYAKEADGRIKKGALCQIVAHELDISSNFSFVEKVLTEISPSRDKVAYFQRYVLEAALAGDFAAVELYRRAASELALLAKAIQSKLSFPASERTVVTYSGGLFHAADLITKPLAEELLKYNCQLKAPMHSAIDGALKLALIHSEKSKEN